MRMGCEAKCWIVLDCSGSVFHLVICAWKSIPRGELRSILIELPPSCDSTPLPLTSTNTLISGKYKSNCTIHNTSLPLWSFPLFYRSVTPTRSSKRISSKGCCHLRSAELGSYGMNELPFWLLCSLHSEASTFLVVGRRGCLEVASRPHYRHSRGERKGRWCLRLWFSQM